ncbi:hypothetical protein [Vibrio hippocampi]|uniref:hypothetical protein n=1 Tax=Vibrio hippocampi TaxID=654686 RepID=UPI001F2D9D33|nr:hypothetical protein [Vibrio hippocampi]
MEYITWNKGAQLSDDAKPVKGYFTSAEHNRIQERRMDVLLMKRCNHNADIDIHLTLVGLHF